MSRFLVNNSYENNITRSNITNPLMNPLLQTNNDGNVVIKDVYVTGSGVSKVSELTDVTLTAPLESTNVLKYNTNTLKRENQNLNIVSSLSSLTDASIFSPLNNQILKYNTGTSKWENQTLNVVSSLSTLSDCTITTPSANQLLKYNGSKWINSTITSEALSTLSDCIIGTPQNNNVLVYSSSNGKWLASSDVYTQLNSLTTLANTNSTNITALQASTQISLNTMTLAQNASYLTYYDDTHNESTYPIIYGYDLNSSNILTPNSYEFYTNNSTISTGIAGAPPYNNGNGSFNISSPVPTYPINLTTTIVMNYYYTSATAITTLVFFLPYSGHNIMNGFKIYGSQYTTSDSNI